MLIELRECPVLRNNSCMCQFPFVRFVLCVGGTDVAPNGSKNVVNALLVFMGVKYISKCTHDCLRRSSSTAGYLCWGSIADCWGVSRKRELRGRLFALSRLAFRGGLRFFGDILKREHAYIVSSGNALARDVFHDRFMFFRIHVRPQCFC